MFVTALLTPRSALRAQALVEFNEARITGQPVNRDITITLHNTGQLQGDDFISDLGVGGTPTNGLYATPLLTNTYDVQIDGNSRVWTFTLTATTGTVDAYPLIQNYVAAVSPVPPLNAGANVTLLTNIVNGQAVITISSGGGGGGNFSGNPNQFGADGAGNAVVKSGATLTNTVLINSVGPGTNTATTNFLGSLAGDVTGTQGATVISTLPAISGAALTGLTAANVTGGSNLWVGTSGGNGTNCYFAGTGFTNAYLVQCSTWPTNVFFLTPTVSGTVGTHILTASASVFNAATNPWTMGFTIGFPDDDFSQYWVTKVISGTQIEVWPPLSKTYTAEPNGLCSPAAILSRDNNGTIQGVILDGGGNVQIPCWDGFGLMLRNNPSSNSMFMIFSYNGVDNNGMLFLAGFDTTQAVGFDPKAPFATLLCLSNGVCDMEGGVSNRLGQFAIRSGLAVTGGTTQVIGETNSSTLLVNGAVGFGSTLNVVGTISGPGSGLTALNAGNISSGTIAAARLPLGTASAVGGVQVDNATIIASSGVISVNNIPGSAISSGTVADARLSSNVPLLNAANNFTGTLNTFTNILVTNSAGVARIAFQAATGALSQYQADASGTELGNPASPVHLDTSGNLSANTITANTQFTGNGAGITGMMATSHSWTNYNVPSGSGTNFIVNASGPQNASCLVSNDFVIVGFTNGPGNSIALHLLDLGTTNHNLMFPTAWQLYGMTNVVSTTKGTNSLVILTNTVWASLVIASLDGTANPVATNTAIYIGVSH